ncbi:hypothetical protein NBRC3188_3331 [Acetobacter pasteurianus NBRC 3188]|uniref:Uncharacterized protein n=1 Tax=Acetobacter pasteurianus NBRC 3188 TaxID=1226663 RepID=A0A401WZ75_ACEPA|nr:hypothetical protein NBRC3188_3331 [Acetobacter pasteurianus NBRC 3188]
MQIGTIHGNGHLVIDMIRGHDIRIILHEAVGLLANACTHPPCGGDNGAAIVALRPKMPDGMHIQFAIHQLVPRQTKIALGLVVVARGAKGCGVACIHPQNPVHVAGQMHGGQNTHRLERHDIIGCVVIGVEGACQSWRAFCPHDAVHLADLHINTALEDPRQMHIQMRLCGRPLIQAVQGARTHADCGIKPRIGTIHGFEHKADAIPTAHRCDRMGQGANDLVQRNRIGAI